MEPAKVLIVLTLIPHQNVHILILIAPYQETYYNDNNHIL